MTETVKKDLLIFLLKQSNSEVKRQARDFCLDSGIYKINSARQVTYCCVKVIPSFLINSVLLCRRCVCSDHVKCLNIKCTIIQDHNSVPKKRKRTRAAANTEDNVLAENSITRSEEYLNPPDPSSRYWNPDWPRGIAVLGLSVFLYVSLARCLTVTHHHRERPLRYKRCLLRPWQK